MTKHNFSSIGVVEITFYTNALIILDEMMKIADVELVHWEKKLGGRLVSIIISGDTSAVQAAIDGAIGMGSIVGEENIKVAIAIPSPHPQIINLIHQEPISEEITVTNTKVERPKKVTKTKKIEEIVKVEELEQHKKELKQKIKG